MDTSLINQHKQLAMGQDIMDSGDFDVQKMSSHGEKRPRNYVHGGATMKDHERHAPVRNSRGLSQANPDHGPYD